MADRVVAAAESAPSIAPELAGIRDPFDRVLGWAGVLVVLALFLPLERAVGGAVWYWHLLSVGEATVPALVQALAGIALLSLSHARRPRLDKAIAATLTLGLASYVLLADGHASSELLVLFPRAFAERGLCFAVSAALAAASVGWRTGSFAEQRPRLPALVLAVASLLAAVPILGEASIVMSLIPAASGAYALQASLQKNRQESTAIGWLIALPAGLIVTVGFKGALAYGQEALLLIALRGAALFSAFVMIAAFSIIATLAQLSDPLGAEVPRPTRLLRDDLLYRALKEAESTGLPQLQRFTAGYRAQVARLVRLRFESLMDDARDQFPPPRSPEDLLGRMRRLLIDDRDPTWPKPPRCSRAIHFLGRGRNLELSLVISAQLVLAFSGLVQLALLPRAEAWPQGDDAAWMTELYQRRLPNIGIASGGGEYAGRDRRLRRTVLQASQLAAPAPELSSAIRALTPLVIGLPERHRALSKAIDELNQAARDSGVPYYLDVDLVPVRRGRTYLHYLYVKSYRIERVRHAKEGLGEYTALWLSRADATNVLDARLGWTRQNEHHGMVVLDVVRDYWLNDVAPALAGIEENRVQRIYARHRAHLAGELARASAELLDLPLATWRPIFDSRLACLRDEEPEPECAQLAALVDETAVEILARKVETHELQHVIDGKLLRPPAPLQRAMASYSEDALTFATAELSAYLAEVARSGQPRIALVHFLALAAVEPYHPEGFAGRVALDHLMRGSETNDQLLDLPERELADRARAAYQALFDARLPELTRRDG